MKKRFIVKRPAISASNFVVADLLITLFPGEQRDLFDKKLGKTFSDFDLLQSVSLNAALQNGSLVRIDGFNGPDIPYSDVYDDITPSGANAGIADAQTSGTGVSVISNTASNILTTKGLQSTNAALTVAANTNTVDFTLNAGQIDHQDLDGIGTNTHAQIDDHISDLNPHNTTLASLGSFTLAEFNTNLASGSIDLTTDPRTPTSHAATHQHNGSDEIATATAAANAIPKANGSGLLGTDWIPNGGDATAIHTNISSEISGVTAETGAVTGDQLLIEKGSDGSKRSMTVGVLSQSLDVFTSTLRGAVPASGGGTSNFLRADGSWAAPTGGGGGTTITAFSGYNSSSQTFTGTAVTLTLNATHKTNADYSLASNQVTINTTGTYIITYTVGLQATASTSRTHANSWLELNSTEVNGTRGELYCRQTNHGATASHTLVLDLVATDVLRLRGQRTAGGATLNLPANRLSLCIRKIA